MTALSHRFGNRYLFLILMDLYASFSRCFWWVRLHATTGNVLPNTTACHSNIGADADRYSTATPTPDPSTPTATPAPDSSTPAPTFPPTPGPATQVKTALPLLLNCHCASNPLQIQITDAHIDPANGRMTWQLAIRNISTQTHQVQLSHLVLSLNGQDSPAEGGIMTNALTIAPNGVLNTTVTFTFVPQQATYTIKLRVWLDSGFSAAAVSYDDVDGNGTNQIIFQ